MTQVADPGSGLPPVAHGATCDTVIMRGGDDASFNCGACDAPILVGVTANQVERFLFRCRRCGAALRIA